MAEIAVWLQLTNPVRIRKVSATSLTWLFGRITRGTVMYSSTAGTVVSIDTFSSVVESAATSLTTVIDTQPFTVAQEQVAVTTPNTGGTGDALSTYMQLSPYVRNTSVAELTPATVGEGYNLAAGAELQRVIDITTRDYVRFTGTELPAAGLMFWDDEIAGMFTTEPSASQL